MGTAAAAAAKSLQSCLTLCDPRDGSPPGSPSLGFSRQEHWSGLPFWELQALKILIHVFAQLNWPLGLKVTKPCLLILLLEITVFSSRQENRACFATSPRSHPFHPPSFPCGPDMQGEVVRAKEAHCGQGLMCAGSPSTPGRSAILLPGPRLSLVFVFVFNAFILIGG